jgi:phosphate/sulfate permease
MALFLEWPSAPLYGLVIGTGLICYISARHFFDSFDEPYTKLLAYVWAYFAAALTWILGHWLLFYGVIAQPTLFLTVIGFGFAALYYLDHYDRLTILLRWEFLSIMAVIIVIVLVFSNWGSKVV